MPPSKRIQFTIGERAYKDLENLAEMAELDIYTEARLLLQWGIELAKRRWRALTEDDDPPGESPANAPGWQQPLLPMIGPMGPELENVMDEIEAEHQKRGGTAPVGRIFTLPNEEG